MTATVYFGWRLGAKGKEEGGIVCHPLFQVTTEDIRGETNLPETGSSFQTWSSGCTIRGLVLQVEAGRFFTFQFSSVQFLGCV